MNERQHTQRGSETLNEYYERLREKSDREDLVMFINACFAATRQNEFYTDRFEQSVSIDFLHQYVMNNYRRIYARTIASGINHFNRAEIIANLLASGAPATRLSHMHWSPIGPVMGSCCRLWCADKFA